MQTNRQRKQLFLSGCAVKAVSAASLVLGLALSPIVAVPALAQSEGHQITMKNVDIAAFIEDVSVVTGKTFLIDPRIQGKVNIASEPVSYTHLTLPTTPYV